MAPKGWTRPVCAFSKTHRLKMELDKKMMQERPKVWLRQPLETSFHGGRWVSRDQCNEKQFGDGLKTKVYTPRKTEFWDLLCFRFHFSSIGFKTSIRSSVSWFISTGSDTGFISWTVVLCLRKCKIPQAELYLCSTFPGREHLIFYTDEEVKMSK